MPRQEDTDSFARRSFWPRMTQPGVIAADYDHDRPCGHCGYNLRGLPMRSPCPECGAVRGITTTNEPIPWDEERGVTAFFATVAMVLGRPGDFARQVWRPVWLDPRRASRFRCICLIIGVMTLAATSFCINRETTNLTVAITALPVSFAGALVWLHGFCRFLDSFFRRNLAPAPLEPRAKVVAMYPSATLLLLPLGFALLPVTLRLIRSLPDPLNWLVAASAHLVLIFLLLLPGVIAWGWMKFEMVDVTPSRAIAESIASLVARIVSATVMLILIPALATMLAARAMGR